MSNSNAAPLVCTIVHANTNDFKNKIFLCLQFFTSSTCTSFLLCLAIFFSMFQDFDLNLYHFNFIGYCLGCNGKYCMQVIVCLLACQLTSTAAVIASITFNIRFQKYAQMIVMTSIVKLTCW